MDIQVDHNSGKATKIPLSIFPEYTKYEGIVDIMDALLEECLIHELVRFLSQISQLLYELIPFIDEGLHPPHVY